MVSTGWEPQVLLCMAQSGARSTHMVVFAAAMGLEKNQSRRRVRVLVVCCEWFLLTGLGRWGPNGRHPHYAQSALPFHGYCC